MFNLKHSISKRNLKIASDACLTINIDFHQPEQSPRSWGDSSTLISNEPVAQDLTSKDIVFELTTKTSDNINLNTIDVVKQFTTAKGLDIEDMAWLPVYKLCKDGKPFYSSCEASDGSLIGFMYESIKETYSRMSQPVATEEQVINQVKEKMQQELVLLNRWIRGGFIKLSLTNLSGEEIAVTENILNRSEIDKHVTKIMSKTQENARIEALN